MNHFSYPLTIVQINIFEEPQISFPNQNPRPQTIEPVPSPVFLTIECPPPPPPEPKPNSTAKATTDILKMLEGFTCKLHGSKTTSDIKEIRYLVFCAKRGVGESSSSSEGKKCRQFNYFLNS